MEPIKIPSMDEQLAKLHKQAAETLGTDEHTLSVTAGGWTVRLPDKWLGDIVRGGDGCSLDDALAQVVAERRERAALFVDMQIVLGECRSCCLDDEADTERVLRTIMRALCARRDAD